MDHNEKNAAEITIKCTAVVIRHSSLERNPLTRENSPNYGRCWIIWKRNQRIFHPFQSLHQRLRISTTYHQHDRRVSI